MRKLILFILLFVPILANSQIRIEVVTEMQDTMALINKSDIDIINKVFFEKNKLDNLNIINTKIIDNLDLKIIDLNKIIENKDTIIYNNNFTIQLLKENYNLQQEYNNEKIDKLRKKRNIWMSTTFASIVVIIFLL